MTSTDLGKPRPPEGDWLGTPYLRLERRGSIAVLTVDRPEARNALTGAMYFADSLRGRSGEQRPRSRRALITGTDDVFIPGGDLGAQPVDDWGGPRLSRHGLRHRSTRSATPASRSCARSTASARAVGCSSRSCRTWRSRASARRFVRRRSTAASPTPATRSYLPARSARRAPRTCSSPAAGHRRRSSGVGAGRPGRSARGVVVGRVRGAGRRCMRGAPRPGLQVKRVISQSYGQYDRMTMDESLAGPEALEGLDAFKDTSSARLGSRGSAYRGPAVTGAFAADIPPTIPAAVARAAQLWPDARGARRRRHPASPFVPAAPTASTRLPRPSIAVGVCRPVTGWRSGLPTARAGSSPAFGSYVAGGVLVPINSRFKAAGGGARAEYVRRAATCSPSPTSSTPTTSSR